MNNGNIESALSTWKSAEKSNPLLLLLRYEKHYLQLTSLNEEELLGLCTHLI